MDGIAVAVSPGRTSPGLATPSSASVSCSAGMPRRGMPATYPAEPIDPAGLGLPPHGAAITPWTSDSFSCSVIWSSAICARWAAGREAFVHGQSCAAAAASPELARREKRRARTQQHLTCRSSNRPLAQDTIDARARAASPRRLIRSMERLDAGSSQAEGRKNVRQDGTRRSSPTAPRRSRDNVDRSRYSCSCCLAADFWVATLSPLPPHWRSRPFRQPKRKKRRRRISPRPKEREALVTYMLL